jgi:hypothetical protein
LRLPLYILSAVDAYQKANGTGKNVLIIIIIIIIIIIMLQSVLTVCTV